MACKWPTVCAILILTQKQTQNWANMTKITSLILLIKKITAAIVTLWYLPSSTIDTC